MCLILEHQEYVSDMGKIHLVFKWKADKINHINGLELKEIFIAVQTYCKGKTLNMSDFGKMSDNKTAIFHKPVIKKFKTRKVYTRFKDNIWAANLAQMESLSSKNK